MNIQALSDALNQDHACVHATCVAVGDTGLLIIGTSGAGKSALALEMMALGAGLVADDRTILSMRGDQIIADAVSGISGMIEARGIGLIRAATHGPVSLCYVVDLDQNEPARLPDPITIQVLRQTVPLLRGGGVPNLAAALIQLLKMGRVDPEWPST